MSLPPGSDPAERFEDVLGLAAGNPIGMDVSQLTSLRVRNLTLPLAGTPIARWSASGTRVTDTVLVAVDDSPESSRAVALAGRIAAAHGGTVTILGAPARDPALQRAIAAGGRVLLDITGAAPRRFGEQLPREHAIPSAATALTATLVVLGSGNSEPARRMTGQIAGAIGCSVLAVPPVEPMPMRRFVRDAQARSGPASPTTRRQP
jgi:nucleotide-binding universal stress UspA family protein